QVAADLGSGGLWFWTAGNGWAQLTNLNPVELALADNGDVYTSLTLGFAQFGFWRWSVNGGWIQLSASHPEAVRATPYGLVFGDFGGLGLWRWAPGGGWQLLTALNAESFQVADTGVLFGDFGGSGLWRWAGTWVQLTPLNPSEIDVTPGGEVYASFVSGF